MAVALEKYKNIMNIVSVKNLTPRGQLFSQFFSWYDSNASAREGQELSPFYAINLLLK